MAADPAHPTRVYLTVDIEGAEERPGRDGVVPPQDYDLRVWGRFANQADELGLPVLLDRLERHGLPGTFFVEIIFNWPGLGLFTVRSLLNVDYPAIMGMTLFGAVGYVFINLFVDLLQAWIDPRISLK